MDSTRKNKLHIISIAFFLCAFFMHSLNSFAQKDNDTSYFYNHSQIHQIGVETRLGYVFPTNPFLRGQNDKNEWVESIYSTHLKYSFRFSPDSYVNKIYRGVYQGIGLAHYDFRNKKEIGQPIALYLFQGATIAKISRDVSLNYEWNFGISGGWETYDPDYNFYNGMMGSKLNAYMNANFHFQHQLSSQFDLIYGATLTHFSNGNTRYPNAGLNGVDLKLALTYNFNRDNTIISKALAARAIPIREFPRHISTDVVLFGAWRRKGIIFNDEPLAVPGRYGVFGFNINPMYNMNYNLRLGLSLDGVYDSTANVYTRDENVEVGDENTFYKPPINKQLALGVSTRAEYVMPYFTVALGIGANILHGGGDLKGLYQIMALKVEVTRNSFIHIGYNLQSFKTPNYLMMGIGYRFGNKHPRFYQ